MRLIRFYNNEIGKIKAYIKKLITRKDPPCPKVQTRAATSLRARVIQAVHRGVKGSARTARRQGAKLAFIAQIK